MTPFFEAQETGGFPSGAKALNVACAWLARLSGDEMVKTARAATYTSRSGSQPRIRSPLLAPTSDSTCALVYGCGSRLNRRGKPQVLVHVSTCQGSILVPAS